MATATVSDAERVALQQAGQYAGRQGQDILTPENAPDVGLDPERGFVAKGTPTDKLNPQAVPVPPDTPHPSRTPVPTPEQEAQGPGKPANSNPKYPGATQGDPAQPEAKKAPNYPGATQGDDQPEKKAPVYPGATQGGDQPPADDQSKSTPQKPAVVPTPTPNPTTTEQPQTEQPIQLQPTGQVSPGPTGPAAQPWGPPVEQIAALMAQGKSPGEAYALANNLPPKTLAGKTPTPPAPKTPAPQLDNLGRLGDEDFIKQALADKSTPAVPSTAAKPAAQPAQTKEQAYQSLNDDDKALYSSGTNKVEMFGEKPTPQEQAVMDRVKAQVAGTSVAPSTTTAPAAPSDTTTDEPKTIVGGAMLKGTATSFGLNYDGSYDKDDNGIGFFGGVNTRNPKLQGVAVPVDVLEATFGKFTQSDGHGGYNALNTPEAKKIIAEIRSAHVEALGLDGKIHSFPIVDIQGSLGHHPGKVLDMTPAAGRTLGFNDNHSVSYQIVGGDGKPYAIPADQLAGWNAGGGDQGGGGKKGVNPLAGQPLFSIPLAGSGGSSSPARQLNPPFSGGGGEMTIPSASTQSGAGSIGLGGLVGGALAGAAVANAVRGDGSQPQAPDDQAQQNPMVTALMQRGFTQAQAIQFAQSSAAIAPGKGIGPLNVKGPPPPAPTSATQLPQLPTPSGTRLPQLPAPSGVQLNLSGKQPVTPQVLSAKQLMPSFKAQAPKVDPSVVLGLIKKGFTREQAIALAGKATVSPGIGQAASFRPQAPAAPGKTIPTGPAIQMGPAAAKPAAKPQAVQPVTPPHPTAKDQPKPRPQPVQEPTEFTGRPAGSTHGHPNPPGIEALTGALKDQGKQHKALLSADDPRVSKQADGLIKGEHFLEGDPYHDQLLGGLPYGKRGPQRQKLRQAEEAITDKEPLHISYISSPKELEKFPTRESRRIQYEKSTPEARLMKATEGALVGHSMIPLNVGVKLPTKAEEKEGETHQGYMQGISTNVMANNFQHINDKLQAMGRKTPYKELGTKFANDLEGYYSNLLAGHTATGRGYAIGTEDHPNTPDREHVPYKLTRKEADFINLVVNNTSAFAQHDDAKKIRELARANGTLITEKGETNQLAHDIEQIDPGWHGRDKGGHGRVLEPSIKTFKTGLVHEIHPSEQHLPDTIRPGKEYQQLTKALARTSQRGRPDIAIGASLHHTFQDNKAINDIERDFSDHKIDEAAARDRLHALGEDPDDYRFVGGSGGLITPYEDDPEALTPEEHTTMKNNLRQAWVGGKMNAEDYRKKSAEVPLPSKPSKPAEPKPVAEAPEISAPPKPAPLPRPLAPPKPKPPKPQPVPEPEPAAPEEKPEKVKSAAMRIGGKHYEGSIHADALENARTQGAKGPYESGFTTNKGRFVSAEEAWDLGQKNKQLKEGAAPIRTKKGGPASGLTSADLKPEEEPSEEAPEPAAPPKKAPAPDEPLPKVKADKPAAVSPPEPEEKPAKAPAPDEPLPPSASHYVSPNVKEGTDLGGALKQVQSAPHKKARDFYQRVEEAHRPGDAAKITPTIGNWEGTQEGSSFTHHDKDTLEDARMKAALKGLHSAQKGTAVFHHHDDGPDFHYDIDLPEHSHEEADKLIAKHGFQASTIFKTPQGLRAHLIDPGAENHEHAKQLAAEAKSKSPVYKRGTAAFDGADDRAGAAESYRKVLAGSGIQIRGGQGGVSLRGHRAQGQHPLQPLYEEAEDSFAQHQKTIAKGEERAKEAEQEKKLEQDRAEAAADRATISPERQAGMERLNKKAKSAIKQEGGIQGLDPVSMHAHLTGQRTFPGKLKNEHIGEYYDANNPKLDYEKDEDRERVSHAVYHDILHALAGTTTGGKPSEAYGWYDETVKKSLKKTAEVAPKILTHPDHELAWKLALAITSQGQDVYPNAESTWHAYNHWIKTGRLPESREIFGGGLKAEQMEDNFKKINKLWYGDEKTPGLGHEALKKRLMKRMTVGELKKQFPGLDVPGELAHHEVNGAMFMGPKIGAFFSNLNGDYDPTTMDLWFSRNMNLMAGNMFKFSDDATRVDRMEKGKLVKSHLSQLRDALNSGMLTSVDEDQAKKMSAELSALMAHPEGKLDRPTARALAPEIYNWANEQHRAYQRSYGSGEDLPEEQKGSYHTDFKTPENLTAKKLDEGTSKLADAPRNGTERHQWRDIIARAHDKLKKVGIKLVNADKQALLWFVIKDLFRKAGSPQRDKADYLDAAYTMVRKVKEGALPPLPTERT